MRIYKLTGFLTVLVFSTISITLPAQSNTTLDTFLERPKADLATTVWLVYLASGVIPQDFSPTQAMETFFASDTAIKVKNLEPAAEVRFADFAWIVMDVMDLPGGLMFSIVPSPRYAAREFTYRRWIPGRPMPGQVLTPWEITTSLSEVLTWMEKREKTGEK